MRDIKRLKEELELVHKEIERIEKLREDLKQTSEKLDQEIEKLNKSAQECFADTEIDRSDAGKYFEEQAGFRSEQKGAVDKSRENLDKELKKLKYREREGAKAAREAEKQMGKADAQPGKRKGLLQQAAEAVSDAFSVLIDAGGNFIKRFQKSGSKGNDFSGISPEDLENLEKQIREALSNAKKMKEQARDYSPKEETVKSKETIEYIIGQQNMREEQKVLNIAALCAQTGEKVHAGIGQGKALSFSCREENGLTYVDITEIDINGKEKEAKVAEIPVREGLLGRNISREDISVLDFDRLKKAVTGRELTGLSAKDREKLSGQNHEKARPEEKAAGPKTQPKEPEKTEKAAEPEAKKETQKQKEPGKEEKAAKPEAKKETQKRKEPEKGSFDAALKEELKKDAARFAEKDPEKRSQMPSADFEKLYPKAETLRLAREFGKAAAEAKKNPGKEIAVGKDYIVSYSVMEGKPDRLFVARTDNKNFRKSVRVANKRGEALPFVKKNGSMGYNTVFGQVLSTGIIKDTAPMREISEKYGGHTQFTAEETKEILGAAARQSAIDKERGTKDMNIILNALNVKAVSEPVLQDAVSALVGNAKDNDKKQGEIVGFVQALKEDPQLSGIAAGFEVNALYGNMRPAAAAKNEQEKPQNHTKTAVQELAETAETPGKKKDLLSAVIFYAERDRKDGTHNADKYLLDSSRFTGENYDAALNLAKANKDFADTIDSFIFDDQKYYENFPAYAEICHTLCQTAIANYGEQYDRYVGLGDNIEDVTIENITYSPANSTQFYDEGYRPINAGGRPATIEDAKAMNPALYQDLLDGGWLDQPQKEEER